MSSLMNTINKVTAITCRLIENKHFIIPNKFMQCKTRETYGMANSSSEEYEPGVLLTLPRPVSVWSAFLYSSSYNMGRRLICV